MAENTLIDKIKALHGKAPKEVLGTAGLSKAASTGK
jgi:hypothetical protein